MRDVPRGQVDHRAVTKEGLPAALLGNDRPGSTVCITVKRDDGSVRAAARPARPRRAALSRTAR